MEFFFGVVSEVVDELLDRILDRFLDGLQDKDISSSSLLNGFLNRMQYQWCRK